MQAGLHVEAISEAHILAILASENDVEPHKLFIIPTRSNNWVYKIVKAIRILHVQLFYKYQRIKNST